MISTSPNRSLKRSAPFAKSMSIYERLRRLWDIFSYEDKVLILISADPDSIASALALRRLLWRRIYSSTIAHINEINRPDNLAMIRLLKVPLLKIEAVDPSQFNKRVIIDSQPAHHETFSRFQYEVIIDHHPVTEGLEAAFIDIRPEYGATASLMTEYLRTAKIRPSATIATALLYAIKADTHNFETEASQEDVTAFRYLFGFANKNIVRKIEYSEMFLSSIPYYKWALSEMKVKKRKRIYAHLGKVTNPDICVLIADFFMRIHDISWSIVSGIHGGRLIVIFRNDGYRKNAGKLAAAAFSQLGVAGGHRASARAEIPLDNLKNILKEIDDKTVGKFIRRQVEHRPLD